MKYPLTIASYLFNAFIISTKIPVAQCLSSSRRIRNRGRNRNPSIFSQEEELRERGFQYVIGSDEVGRGSIAGPVLVASCCLFVDQYHFEGGNVNGNDNDNDNDNDNGDHTMNVKTPILTSHVGDSKSLTEQQRCDIYDQITSEPYTSMYRWSCAQRSAEQIEESNILKATMECFRDSIQDLVLRENMPLDETYSIVDGKKTPKLVNGPTPIPCRPMVNADAKVYTVSIASIIAKVTRDKIMVEEAHAMYPEYNFHINKGYATRDHIERIHKHGPCPLHRMSFKPLRNR